MSDRAALTGLTVGQLRDGFRNGSIMPVEVVNACLDRIAAVNPVLNAHWHVAAESALAAAERAGRRYADGTDRPLEGIPVGVKDTIDVAGMPATLGSRLYRDRVPERDATVVDRLRRAGAIVLTKDATSEFAFGSPYNPLYGFTGNPWRPGHWAGGSSAGGAAGVAARCLPLAIGTDAGGSVRAPAGWSGVTGLKPTKGLVSRTGVMSLSWTMCTVGVLAGTALDAAAALSVLAGPDPADPQSVPAPEPDRHPPAPEPGSVAGLRIGVPWDWAARDADRAQVAALAAAVEVLRAAGAEIVALPTPGFSRRVGRIGYHLLQTEAAYALREHRHRPELDPDLVDRVDQGAFVTAAGYLDALRFRGSVQRELAGVFGRVDLLAMPTTIGTAPAPDGTGRGVRMTVNGRPATVGGGQSPWTVTVNLAGLPAIAVPTGFADGLPLSMQLVAPPFRERRCVAAAAAFQHRTSHHQQLPPILAGDTAPAPVARSGAAPASAPPASAPPAAIPADLATLAGWFGETVPPARLAGVRASLDRAAEDMRALRDPPPSSVDGSADPGHGDAFLRSYPARDGRP